MDIKNTVSFVGEGVQVATIKPVRNNETQTSVVKDADKIFGKEVVDDQEKSLSILQEKDVEKALSDVNHFFQAEQRKLSFSVNEISKKVVIEVKDAETDQVIRQIPPEFVVRLAEHLNELSTENGDSGGYLLRDKA